MAEQGSLWSSWIQDKFLPACRQTYPQPDIKYKKVKTQQQPHQFSQKTKRSRIKLIQPTKNKRDESEIKITNKKNTPRLTMDKLRQQIQRNDLKQHQIQIQINEKQAHSNHIDFLKSNKFSEISFGKVQPSQNLHRYYQATPIKCTNTTQNVTPQQNNLYGSKFSSKGRLSSTFAKTPQNQQTQTPQISKNPSFQLARIRSEISIGYSNSDSFSYRPQNQIISRLDENYIKQIQSLEQSKVTLCRSSHQSLNKVVRLDESVVQWTFETGFKSQSSKNLQQHN